MLYEISHFIKEKCVFLWNTIEWGNSLLFGLRYNKGIKEIPTILKTKSSLDIVLSEVKQDDCKELSTFFLNQPIEAFQFFKPHRFDENSLIKLAKRKSHIMIIARKGNAIVGYAFMRSFINKQTYRGYIVDSQNRGQGIAKLMGYAMNDIGDLLNMKMFKSIATDNVASLAATKSVCILSFVKVLDNGDYLYECESKKR